MRVRHLTLSFLLTAFAPSVQSATLCATTGAELKAHLNTADSNGQADEIRLATGTYGLPNGEGYTYAPVSTENFDLVISGGWTSFFSNPCGQQLDSTNTYQTVLSNDGSNRLLRITTAPSSTSEVSVSRLTFLNGNSGTTGLGGGGLQFTSGGAATNELLLDRCAFIGNDASFGGGINIEMPNGRLHLRNSVFANNHAEVTGGAAYVYMQGDGRVYVTNNTVVNNTVNPSTVSSLTGGLNLNAVGSSQLYVANNNLWDNMGFDLDIGNSPNSEVVVRNNNVDSSEGVPAGSTGNISVTPTYEAGELNFTAAVGSPLLDAGTRPPLIGPTPRPFDQAWGTGALDIAGMPRVQGPQIDIGSHEAFPIQIFKDGFEG